MILCFPDLDTFRLVVTSTMLPSAVTVEDDKRLRALRKDAKVSAVLHTAYPVRYWDHDIGPAAPHLLAVEGVRDLTPNPGQAMREAGLDVSIVWVVAALPAGFALMLYHTLVLAWLELRAPDAAPNEGEGTGRP